MKIISILATLLASTVASAFPAVGDSVRYQVLVFGIPLTQDISLTAFNAETRQFTKLTVSTQQGQPPSSTEEQVDADSIPSDAQIEQVLLHCEHQGGMREKITVAAGTFDTCKSPIEGGGFAWVGAVPFALVKAESQWNFELTAFTRGQ